MFFSLTAAEGQNTTHWFRNWRRWVRANSHQQLPTEDTERLSRALVQAVAQYWSNLPQATQHALFEAGVSSQREIVRQDLAPYLHEKHARTREVLQAKAMPTPDTLGG
jgi:predicted alpha/beta hydrolase